ncbi:hypothetical protein, partial [Mesotoga prima]|uniref:hypothetical protein n=1 Tax=Mesotoga prima TaxID=1184387 RepID=UPI002C3856C4
SFSALKKATVSRGIEILKPSYLRSHIEICIHLTGKLRMTVVNCSKEGVNIDEASERQVL